MKVLVPKIDSLMGKMVEVEVVECTKFSMKGKLSDEDFTKYTNLAAQAVKQTDNSTPKVYKLISKNN